MLSLFVAVFTPTPQLKMELVLSECAFAQTSRGTYASPLKHYDHQLRTCRRCNRTGHIARECSSYACFNCDELGHVASACTHRLRCSICKSSAHKAFACPFALIDNLNSNLPINTILADALASVPINPPSTDSSDNSDNSDSESEDEDDLVDANTLEHASHHHSSSSGHSTVLSSVHHSTGFTFAAPTPVNTLNFATPKPPPSPKSQRTARKLQGYHPVQLLNHLPQLSYGHLKMNLVSIYAPNTLCEKTFLPKFT